MTNEYINSSDYIRDSQAGTFDLDHDDIAAILAPRNKPVLKLRYFNRIWHVIENEITVCTGDLNKCIGHIRDLL